MQREELKERVRRFGLRLGCARVGFTTADPLPHAEHLARWIDSGMAAGMESLARTVASRHLPLSLLPSARTAIVVAASYGSRAAEAEARPGVGVIARYARGRDYHLVLRERLTRLAVELARLAGRRVATRIAVDTSPLLERALAARAGLGFVGKNTLLVTPGLGSYTVLGVLLVDLELPPDPPPPPLRRCGRCMLCLEACPTGALVAPYQLDARRCVSYLTIEERGAIDEALRARFTSQLFGCDLCQEACPYNAVAPRRALPDPDLAPAEPLASLPLADLLTLRTGDHRRLVRGRALARASRITLVRNAIVLAGARRCVELRPEIETVVDDPRLGGQARWALARMR